MAHDAICKLHRLAHAVISGQAVWPASPDDTNSIWEMMAESGLVEELPDNTRRYTEVGSASEIELLLVCIGVIYLWDMPFFLERHGFASEQEIMEVFVAETEREALRLLRLLIFRAYAKRYLQSTSRH